MDLYLRRSPFPPSHAQIQQVYVLEGDPTQGQVDRIRVPSHFPPVLARGVLPDPVSAREGAGGPRRLKVLHINDLHGNITRLTPHGPRPVFSRHVWRVRQLRRHTRQNPATSVLFVSAGDDLAGSVFDSLFEEKPGLKTHAAYRLYSAAGLDAAVIGNHDLDHGSQALAEAIRRDAKFPVLSANLTKVPHLEGCYFPAALLVTNGIRVGLIGLTTPSEIRRNHFDPFALASPIQVMESLLPAMQPLCDVVIVLSHLGHSLQNQSSTVSEVGDTELAACLPKGAVHLMIGGHTHQPLNENRLAGQNVVNGIPIVQAGALGEYIGEVTFALDGGTAVTDACLNQVSDLPADEEFEREFVQPLIDRLTPKLRRKLGRVSPRPELHAEPIRSDFASGESLIANFLTDMLVSRCRLRALPVDFAMIDLSVVHAGLPAGGDLYLNDLMSMVPYPDTIRVCWMTGRQLSLLLADNAQRINFPGEPHMERGFIHFSREIRYQIQFGLLSADSWVSEASLNGQPLESQLERKFLAASPSYLRRLATPWEREIQLDPAFHRLNIRAWPFNDTGLFLRQELVAHVEEFSGVTEASGARRDGRLRVSLPVVYPLGVLERLLI